MLLEEEKLKKLLVEENYVSAQNLAQAESYAQEHKSSAIDYLLQQGSLSQALLGQALAEVYNLVFADFEKNPPNEQQVLKIPEDIAKKFRLILYKDDSRNFIAATDTPTPEALAALAPFAGKKKVALAYALPTSIEDALLHYRKKLQTRFSEIIKAGKPPGFSGDGKLKFLQLNCNGNFARNAAGCRHFVCCTALSNGSRRADHHRGVAIVHERSRRSRRRSLF